MAQIKFVYNKKNVYICNIINNLNFKVMNTHVIKCELNFTNQIAFASQVTLLQIQVNNTEPQSSQDYQSGIQNYAMPHIEQMLNETIIPDYTTLISIETKEIEDMGTHTWTFALNNIDELDEDDTLGVTLTECFQDIFPYDPQACFGYAPTIKYINGFFTVIVPFTC